VEEARPPEVDRPLTHSSSFNASRPIGREALCYRSPYSLTPALRFGYNGFLAAIEKPWAPHPARRGRSACTDSWFSNISATPKTGTTT
jgi:hypothetical protein